MRAHVIAAGFATLLMLAAALPATAASGPFVNGRFQGRIAYSADGNHNDPDDWIASPLALAIFAEAGLQERLVHFDYNCILPQTNAEWEKIHATSVLGAVERYAYDRSRIFDCRKDTELAVAHIARAINESSADNPLWFILAGPMEVPFRGIQKSDPAKRQFVYCISHSRWNDGFAAKYQFAHTKRSVIEQDVHWVQIRDQNRLLSFGRYGRPAAAAEFSPYFWMRDAGDEKVRWLFERMLVSTRPDPSDAGMAYFLATGDEECNPAKLQRLLAEHRPPAAMTVRDVVRIEAENFRHLDGCVLEDRNDKKASHALNTTLAGGNAGRIRIRFDEPFTQDSDNYDIEVRYFDEQRLRSRFELFVNGVAQSAWQSPGEDRGWMSQTIRNVAINRGDEIVVEVRGDEGATGRLDYVQLTATARSSGLGKGRIAYSCDGNNRDRDDLFASAVSIAMFKAFNAANRVAHFDYNSILGEDNPEYLKVHEESVRGAAQRFGLPPAVIFNDSTDLDAAIASIRDAVNASSAADPLYFIIAGPMEVPWRGIHAADADKRRHVYCISHSVWNDLFFWDTTNPQITHHRRDLIELGVNWVQILTQQGLGTCPEPKHGPCPQEKWALWDWLRDSRRPDVAWLYERLEAMGRPDCSDSGMVYFLLSGNEQPTVNDLNQLLHGRVPAAVAARAAVRLEAENFQLDNFTVPKNRLGSGISQRLAAQLAPSQTTGSIRTAFQQPYAPSGRYDIEVRYLDAKEGHCKLTLFVGGVQQGELWTASSGAGNWQSRTIPNIAVNIGDEIMVKVEANGKQTLGLDYVQFNYRGAASDVSQAEQPHRPSSGTSPN